jgi:hypothetical protein
MYRERSVYARPWPHCRVLRAGRCTEACARAEARYAYNDRVALVGFRPTPWRCPSGTPCLDELTPARVVGALHDLLTGTADAPVREAR